jgi:HEAT repeat protein
MSVSEPEPATEALAEQLQREVTEAQEDHSRYLAELTTTATQTRSPADDTGLQGAAVDGLESTGAASEEPAMIVLTDTSLPEATRVEVLTRLSASLSRRDEYIEALLAIVRDRNDSAAVREAALQVLGSAAFQVLRFRPHQQAYDDALHDLVDDPVPALRETAVTVLAQQRDPVVQETLLDGLSGNRPLPVERERAIQLLAEDDHLDNLPFLQEMYRDGSEEARQEAVRFMGSYPAADATLEGILRDKDESTEVRQQSGAALRSVAPDRYRAAAKEIALDTTDYPEIRTASLTALQHLGDPAQVHADDEFVDALREVSGDESAPEVAEAARGLLDDRPES